MKLSSSQEDYLETIYSEVLKNGFAKVTDISALLNVKKASVTGALNALAKKKLINYSPYSAVTMTQEGERLAREILQKHHVMTDFLKNILHLNEDEALENACKLEHVMSEKMFKRMTLFSEYVQDICEKNQNIKEDIGKLYK